MEFGHNRKRFFFCLKNFKILFFDLAELIKKWKLFSSFFCFVFWDELRSIFEAYKLVLIVFLIVYISFWILSWVGLSEFLQILTIADRDGGTIRSWSVWKGNAVVVREFCMKTNRTRKYKTRNKMWISMEISLQRQFACAQPLWWSFTTWKLEQDWSALYTKWCRDLKYFLF